MQNSQLNWLELNTIDIVSKVTADGVKYLELFLQDYSKLFNKKVVPSCNNCINEYLKEYKENFKVMSNDCKYKLHKKREGIQLEFGSNVHVTNVNITDEYAEKLIERFTPFHKEGTLDFLFDKYPKNTTNSTQKNTRQRRNRKKSTETKG